MIDLVLVALPFLVFWPSVDGAFLFDDFAVERQENRIRHLRESQFHGWLGDLWLFGFDPRGLVRWSFQKNWDWSAFKTRSYHLVNFAIHGVNIVLARHLLERWLSWETSLIAALIFAVHPIQVQSVCYISGRYGLGATFFILASLELIFEGNWALVPLTLFMGLRSKPDIAIVPILAGGLWLITSH